MGEAETTLAAQVDQIDAAQASLSRQVGWTWAAIVALAVIVMIARRDLWLPAA